MDSIFRGKPYAINSSFRREGQSKTELMLSHLVQGMREAGAQVEVVDLRDKKRKYCLGCYACMTKTPGRRIQGENWQVHSRQAATANCRQFGRR